MPAKVKTLAPVRPSAGLEAAYQKKIDSLVDAMGKSIAWWIEAAYGANKPEMAQDAPKSAEEKKKKLISRRMANAIRQAGSPATVLQDVMSKLGAHWKKRFDEAAPELANYFATAASQRVDGALKSILKKSGFSVEFKPTVMQKQTLAAEIQQNVSLIRSIPSQHFTQIEGMVMRSVSAGRDLATLSKELQEQFGVTKRRAALIARDQNGKATAYFEKVRQKELGITEAVWMHSHAGKHPRSEHQKWGAEKKVYKIADGMWSEVAGKFVWPGTEISCRCICRAVLPGLINK